MMDLARSCTSLGTLTYLRPTVDGWRNPKQRARCLLSSSFSGEYLCGIVKHVRSAAAKRHHDSRDTSGGGQTSIARGEHNQKSSRMA
mmetsp:Transcript_91424/g.293683  ORF Transcript_91424/g.293683 Transcript_91424/m.293683 type:complete len:87 (-) Transcript_91424:23-283(-)